MGRFAERRAGFHAYREREGSASFEQRVAIGRTRGILDWVKMARSEASGRQVTRSAGRRKCSLATSGSTRGVVGRVSGSLLRFTSVDLLHQFAVFVFALAFVFSPTVPPFFVSYFVEEFFMRVYTC